MTNVTNQNFEFFIQFNNLIISIPYVTQKWIWELVRRSFFLFFFLIRIKEFTAANEIRSLIHTKYDKKLFSKCQKCFNFQHVRLTARWYDWATWRESPHGFLDLEGFGMCSNAELPNKLLRRWSFYLPFLYDVNRRAEIPDIECHHSSCFTVGMQYALCSHLWNQ